MENLGPSGSQKPIEVHNIFPWKKAWQTLKAIWPQLVYISLVCMSIPQYLLFWISTNKAAELAPAFGIKQAISFEKALLVLQEFGFYYVSVGWIICVLFLIGIFTAIALCIQVGRSETIDTTSAFKSALRKLFPKGLVFLVLAGIFGFVALNVAVQLFPPQLIRFLALIAGVLLSAWPVLMFLMTRPFEAFKAALSLQYVTLGGMSKWSVFFLLMTYQLLALNALALVDWLCAYLLEIDVHLHISRDLVFQSTPQFPFGKLIYITEALSLLGFSLIAMTFVVLNASFVYELHRRNTLGRNIDVVA